MAYTHPLDLQYWFINTLSGSVEVFVAISILAIAFLAGFFRMNNSLFFIGVFLFALFMGAFAIEFYTIAIVMAGLFASWSIARYYSR